MGPTPSRFRNNDQEQNMRTVAYENENVIGSTNDPKANKVSTLEKGQGQTHLSSGKTHLSSIACLYTPVSNSLSPTAVARNIL